MNNCKMKLLKLVDTLFTMPSLLLYLKYSYVHVL